MVDGTLKDLGTEELAARAAEILIEAAKKHIGLKKNVVKTSMHSMSLPPGLVKELRIKRQLERDWKLLLTQHSNKPMLLRTASSLSIVSEAEQKYLDQKIKVGNLFFERKKTKRTKILKQCLGHSKSALKCFWSHINARVKQSSDIDAVLSPTSGVLHCGPVEIIGEVEKHLMDVFNGSLAPVPPVPPGECHAGPSSRDGSKSDDHSYSSSSSPCLPVSDGSSELDTDPSGWLDKDFSVEDVVRSVRKLKNGKARGFDGIPNEFIKNAGIKYWTLLTHLYNRVKRSGSFPYGWNRGRITLVHKRLLREVLGNYRPLTVIVSLSGLYSKLLNERLTVVVEKFGLLGEIQNGFRKGRMGSDNTFILNTILWKEKMKKNKVYMAFLDVTKAYDSVDRGILWEKLKKFGFGGQFLATLQSIYTDDCVQASVNGLTTQPVFLRRGLRQGCSLSPLLFALYIADMGNDITLSSEGFQVGRFCCSGLLFADDLLVLARSSAGLLRLLKLVHEHAVQLRLVINTEKDKSEVISPDGVQGDMWNVVDGQGGVDLSLRQVIEYKYLGNQTFGSIQKSTTEKQKQCVRKAHKYKGTCFYMSRDGPDVVDMLLATWSNVAVPSILNGTEMIPFAEVNILEIERTQNQIAKYALGV